MVTDVGGCGGCGGCGGGGVVVLHYTFLGKPLKECAFCVKAAKYS